MKLKENTMKEREDNLRVKSFMHGFGVNDITIVCVHLYLELTM